jgi:hypothetical protein
MRRRQENTTPTEATVIASATTKGEFIHQDEVLPRDLSRLR